MILQPRTRSVTRRSAFTLLEVLVVVAIILVLASVATVAVLNVLKENKNDAAKMNAINLEKALKTYMIKNDGNPPGSIQDILRYVDGNDPNKLIDPWNQQYQIGTQDNGTGTPSYYVYTTNPETGEQIRSDTKK
jgi:general secretion pathway protein G